MTPEAIELLILKSLELSLDKTLKAWDEKSRPYHDKVDTLWTEHERRGGVRDHWKFLVGLLVGILSTLAVILTKVIK